MRFGVDLRDQAWNQALASVAGEWNLATLDLSAASDHVSYELVRDLLPPDWFTLFSLFRSPLMQISKGHTIKLEKWSTMGNGYTFPLESLIFYAVVKATVPREDLCVCAVYGDDIIVPQADAAHVIERLEYLGFQLNREKSFLAGSFFESCGRDYFHGRQCRPSFAPSNPGPIPKSVQTANGFRLWLKDVFGYCPQRYESLWLALVSTTPSSWRSTQVPASMGDSGIIHDKPIREWLVTDPHKVGFGWEGFLAKRVILIQREEHMLDAQDFAVLMAGLKTIGSVDKDGFNANLFTRGLEPRKGLFGRPMSRYAFTSEWTQGYAWK